MCWYHTQGLPVGQDILIRRCSSVGGTATAPKAERWILLKWNLCHICTGLEGGVHAIGILELSEANSGLSLQFYMRHYKIPSQERVRRSSQSTYLVQILNSTKSLGNGYVLIQAGLAEFLQVSRAVLAGIQRRGPGPSKEDVQQLGRERMERKVVLFTEVWIELLPPPQETWDELSQSCALHLVMDDLDLAETGTSWRPFCLFWVVWELGQLLAVTTWSVYTVLLSG
ncbi:hypothetical protein TURU_050756 [Turdus rufiventris]|nr:hypothetical protein TURU_050756 [Turdus rufiventris]